MPDGNVSLTGWWIGLTIAFAVITAVVVLVSAILTLARRIGLQAFTILADLDQGRMNTLGLWEVEKTNSNIRGITEALRRVRAGAGR